MRKVYPMFSSLDLRESSRGVLLVRLDSLATSELLVGVGGPDNLAALVVDDGEGGEAVAGAKLTAPARGDGVTAALAGTAVGLGGTLGLDDVLAGGGLAGARVDAKVPGALGVGLVAGALEALDGPLGGGGHHGDGLGGGLGSGSSEDAGGGEEGGDDGELHGCGWSWLEVGRERESVKV